MVVCHDFLIGDVIQPSPRICYDVSFKAKRKFQLNTASGKIMALRRSLIASLNGYLSVFSASALVSSIAIKSKCAKLLKVIEDSKINVPSLFLSTAGKYLYDSV